ncbi:MAG: NFACT RNA binding domain-containing protein [Rhodothermales bacterium]
MLLTYYTLTALAAEWAASLPGSTVGDAYSQNRDELSLAFDGSDTEGAEAWTLVVETRPDLRLLFRNPGHGRARRNSASLFEAALGRRVEAVRTAERDRVVFVDLEGGAAFQIQLFGPRPNVWLVEGGVVRAAFQSGEEWEGEPPPAPRAAPMVATFEDFEARWRANRKTVEQAVAAALPLFDRTLAAEAVFRADVETESPGDCSEAERRALFEAAREIEADLAAPTPRILWRGGRAEAFALIDLRHRADDGLREERFDTVDEAVRIFSRRSLAQQRFDALYRPLEQKLAAAADRLARSAERMLDELGSPSRAATYETYGHLLMAQAVQPGPGSEEVTVPDIIGGGEPVTIPLDRALSGIENAERYYDKARRTRAARAHAETRWESVQADAEAAAALLESLRATERLPDLEALIEQEKDALAGFTGREGVGEEREPFRRFALPGGFEAWVGKNAKGNAELTTRYAQPHDLWLHARGVPGSHVVIRRDSKTAMPDRRAVERAAALAAYFSTAKTQSLVPVIVTERKYVRPIKGGPPGLVRIDREDVVLVEPKRPEGSQ